MDLSGIGPDDHDKIRAATDDMIRDPREDRAGIRQRLREAGQRGAA